VQEMLQKEIEKAKKTLELSLKDFSHLGLL
jgi:hypothetical protein